MTPVLDRTGLEQFRTIVARRLGLQYEDEKLDYLAEVARRRMELVGSARFESYLERLISSPKGSDEFRALAEQLTVNETFFFRNADNFRAFAEIVLPERIRANTRKERLRILSAGCASGEEPYSLAVLVREALSDLGNWDVKIIGIDVNPAVLAKATQARYSAWSLRATSEDAKRRYFRADGPDFVLAPAIQKMVTFEERNLVDEDPLFWQSLACDVVFCRNVLMYFTPDKARDVVRRIGEALLPGGFFFLGHAETLRGLTQEFHLCHTHDTFYYRRRDASEAVVATATWVAPSRKQAEDSLTAVVESTAPWVDVIQRASERIATLADGRSGSPGQDAPRTTPAGQAAATAAPRTWDLGLVLEAVRQERFSDALEIVCSLPPDSHEDPDALLLRAVLLTNNGRLNESEEVCNRLLAVDELNAGAHYLMALCREYAGDSTGAIEHGQTAIYLDAGFAMPHLHLGIMAKRSGDVAAAQRELGQALTEATARQQGEAEQEKLDQRLRDQQFYTRSLIESNIDALMTTDPLGIITDVNKQMEALTGCTRDELIGAPSKNYFTDPERAEAAIKLVLSEKKVTDYELTARARDGKKTEVSYNATTFYDRDRTLQGVLAIARDVTERKRNEQALQETNIELASAKSAAEEANLAKSDFLSSMSHELRSPLNAILGFAQLMESASPLPTDSQKESIAQILQAGWHLLKLINEIFDLSVIESGKVSLSTESVSLAEVMSECQAMMEPQAQQRGISVAFSRFDNPLFVSADRTRLKQIVINLLSNAIKYNKERGTVVVDCTTSTPGFTRISVKDTGGGLSPEKLAQLFQPFNRLGQETGGVAGTGIGLVVTKRLAELMGGVLGVESTAGEGSVFWCELISCAAPQLVVESGEAATVDRPPVPAGARPRTLLYVEDNQANMKLVEQLIARRPDMRLLTAVNGTLGIEVARTTRPTVILMDINLPGISGVEALKVLRIDPATAHIPVVALSANAMPRDIEMGLDAGFFRYLTKPIKIKEFMDTLNTALEFAEEELCRRK